MRKLNRLLLAALVSLVTFFCQAEEPVGDYLMYWMVDYSGTKSTVEGKVADATTAGYISSTRDTANDFNWGKLVAVVNGEKTVVGAGELTPSTLKGTETFVADLGGVSGAISSFWVEYYNYQEGGALTLLGWSESISLETLSAKGAIRDITQKTPETGFAAWTPGEFTAVPEPSSGLLLFVGGALLALRRRRRGSKLNVEG